MIKFLGKALSALTAPVRRLGRWIESELIGGSALDQPILIRNEILKLRASAADRLSTACFSVGAAGVVAPLFAPIFQSGPTIPKTYTEMLLIFGATLIWLTMGFVLHMIGGAFLLKLGDK
ncbi:hypothetical protein ACRQ1B_10050 [Rhizobium panacihumi]|uniref:hypothetical protein n=1 Tax=Rhizobium panacihumi TaxID=2008450 RepID=UPI003D794257